MQGHYFSNDTAIAIATSLAGDGGVGIIRLSGPKSLSVVQKFTKGFEHPMPRYLSRIEFYSDLQKQQILDDGLAVYFPAGASFTGEEVVELQMHGGRFLLQQILKTLASSGDCRLAMPGEFSFRAVRNGKATLSSAQAVAQLVKARSYYEIWSARQQLSGQRDVAYKKLADKIRNLLAKTELSIDFIDQDVEVISTDALTQELSIISADLADLISHLQLAQRVAQGPLVVLAGEPNAGKSTLFNSILAEDRAIVSDEAGTTRDVITEEFLLGPYRLRLADTAGLREAENYIEKAGIYKTTALMDTAEVVVLVLDAKANLNEVVLKQLNHDWITKASILILNKIDQCSKQDLQKLHMQLEAVSPKATIIHVSATKGLGISEFLKALQEVLDKKFSLGLSTALPTEHQMQMTLECQRRIDEAKQIVQAQGLSQPELLSAALSLAVQALTDVVGETTPDTILAKIFSEFCIGK